MIPHWQLQGIGFHTGMNKATLLGFFRHLYIPPLQRPITMTMSRSLRSIVLCVLLSIAGQVSSQFVIPDLRFRDWLLEVVPNAINGDTLDTTHVDVLSLTSLTVGENCVNCTPANPQNIDGVQYFVNLEYLNISFTEINSFPVLPNKIRTLLMDYIPHLNLIPAWPDSARYISAKHDYYWDGPSYLQPIPTLPPYLEYLDLYAHLLTVLPPVPTTLVELRMDRNQLTEFPDVPNTLRHLNIRGNLIPAIPALPDSLRYVDVGGAQPFPSLPPFPSMLEQFHCTWITTLQELPEFPPTIQVINTIGTNIPCYPYVPPSVTSWDLFAGTLCIPNRPPNLIAGTAMTKPVCSIITTSCDYFASATGTLFRDINGNGSLDAGEPPMPQAYATAEPDGNLSGPDLNGHYFLPLDSGSHVVSGIAPQWYQQTTLPQQVEITVPFQIDSLRHIGFQPTPGTVDLMVDLTGIGTPARPGFAHRLRLIVRNIGTQVTSGTVVLQFDPLNTWVSGTPAPAAQNGSTATWQVPLLDPGEQIIVNVYLSTPSSAPLGTALNYQLMVTADDPDVALENNTVSFEQTIMGSYDPNEKEVVPTFLEPIEVLQGERLTYTIRFQNTGTFLAERVVITDTLPLGLQWNTLHVIDSSHPSYWFVDAGILHFVFDDIMLPDSSSNEPESHGLVRFTIEPVSSLMVGDEVENIANIHFDFNDPIITEPCVFTVTTATGQVEQDREAALILMPNPASTELMVRIDGDLVASTLKILALDGRVVHTMRMNGRNPVIDVSSLASGTYLIELATTDGSRMVERFNKE